MYDRWNLDDLYLGFDDPNFVSDMAKLDDYNNKLEEYATSLGSKNASTTIKEILLLQEEYHNLIRNLLSYASLKQSAQTTDSEIAMYFGQLLQKLQGSTKANTLMNKYIAKVDNLDEVIKEDDLLQEYSYYLHELKANDEHMLAEDIETVIGKFDLCAGSGWSDMQGYLTSTVKVDYQGEETNLSAIRNLAYSQNADERKEGYEAELASYEKIKDAVAYSLNNIKLQDIMVSEMRGFDSPLDRVLFNSKMKKETLEALLEALKEYLPNFQSYLKAKAVALGHENGLPWYDLFAPMGACERQYTVEEAKEYLLNIFNEENPQMAQIVERAFNEEWIDFFPREGKVGGAFCSGLGSKKQFRILTNYGGSISDIVTLAHELGHGYHDFMTHDNRPLNTRYSMPVAETASTFNENVVVNYAIKHANSDAEKLNLLEEELSGVTQITCDIYSRFLFESKVVEDRSNKFMFADELCEMMLDAQKQAYGDGLDANCLHPYMWVCKSHYYSADNGFYNFPYAFGGLFARGLYNRYVQEGKSFIAKYNYLLQQTPLRSVEDVAKICDIDLTNKQFWLESLHSYDEDIEEYKRLVLK